MSTKIKSLGFKQLGAGVQLTLAVQPDLTTLLSLLNLKVKHPSGLEDMNGPGNAVPQKDPARPPGTLPLELLLAI